MSMQARARVYLDGEIPRASSCDSVLHEASPTHFSPQSFFGSDKGQLQGI